MHMESLCSAGYPDSCILSLLGTGGEVATYVGSMTPFSDRKR